MAGGVDFDEDEGITGINVTPLVDVMLVLLIIFMVTANYINTQAIDLELPKAETGESTGDRSMGFTISKDSQVLLDGEAVNMDKLPEIIKQRKKSNPKVQALIAADQATPHGTVIKLIDIIRKNGVTDFAINVEIEVQEK